MAISTKTNSGRRFRVYDAVSLKLVGVVTARSKDEAAMIAADKMDLQGQQRYLFCKTATVKMVKAVKS